MKEQNPIRVFGLSRDVINQLQQMALERYDKASASLMLRKLAEEQVRLTETHTEPVYQKNIPDKPRSTITWLPNQYRYLVQKATLQHDSLNSIVRDIVQEYMKKNPVLNNDDVQALYQSNYQLLRLGRNINQIARQLNSVMPQSITTRELNALLPFLQQHTEIVGRVLRKQGKPFRYRPIGEHHATTEQTD